MNKGKPREDCHLQFVSEMYVCVSRYTWGLSYVSHSPTSGGSSRTSRGQAYQRSQIWPESTHVHIYISAARHAGNASATPELIVFICKVQRCEKVNGRRVQDTHI